MSQKNHIIEQTFWQKTKRFFEPVSYVKKDVLGQVFKGMIAWGTPFIHVLFFQKLIYFFENGEQVLFTQTLIIYVGIIILIELIDLIVYHWGWFRVDPSFISYLTQNYTRKYITLDNTTLERYGTGKIISVIDRGVTTWSRNLTLFFWNVGGILTSFLITFYFTFMLNSYLGLFFFFYLVVILIFSSWADKKMRSFRNKRIEVFHRYTRQLVKIIMAKNEIMNNQNISIENQKIKDYIEKDVISYNLKQAPYFHAIYRVPHFSITIFKFVLLYYYSVFIFSGEVSLSVFIGIFGVLILFENSILQFIQFFKNFTKEFAPIVSLWHFFDTTPQIEGYEEGNIFEYKKGDIQLKNITYSYDENVKVFENFSLTIPGSQITALVGPSGGGKSTLVKLISGYIRQDSGDILIDSQNLTETSLKSYYQSVGYLTQEPSVFDGTVRENLMYGVTNLETTSETDLKKIITLSHAEFIYDLPNGLDTEIGERGVKLSGGQKQRLAIAKIFLKNPQIIILDEPTSALDSLSEKKITEAMHNLFKGRTVIVIAHRLQTVKYADTILVIDNGEVIEEGTHTSLTRKKGFYKEMLDLQSGF